MRLWHKDLLPLLPSQRILGQHSEACGMRGNGWGRKHATVDYVFDHPYSCLYHYHTLVMAEMQRRGYNVDKLWLEPSYRGKVVGEDKSSFTQIFEYCDYPEHNDAYLAECLENLAEKGILIDVAQVDANP